MTSIPTLIKKELSSNNNNITTTTNNNNNNMNNHSTTTTTTTSSNTTPGTMMNRSTKSTTLSSGSIVSAPPPPIRTMNNNAPTKKKTMSSGSVLPPTTTTTTTTVAPPLKKNTMANQTSVGVNHMNTTTTATTTNNIKSMKPSINGNTPTNTMKASSSSHPTTTGKKVLPPPMMMNNNNNLSSSTSTTTTTTITPRQPPLPYNSSNTTISPPMGASSSTMTTLSQLPMAKNGILPPKRMPPTTTTTSTTSTTTSTTSSPANTTAVNTAPLSVVAPPKRKAMIAPPPTPNIKSGGSTTTTLPPTASGVVPPPLSSASSLSSSVDQQQQQQQQQQEQLMYLQNFQSYAHQYPSLLMLQQQQQQQAAAHQVLYQYQQQALLAKQQQQQQQLQQKTGSSLKTESSSSTTPTPPLSNSSSSTSDDFQHGETAEQATSSRSATPTTSLTPTPPTLPPSAQSSSTTANVNRNKKRPRQEMESSSSTVLAGNSSVTSPTPSIHYSKLPPPPIHPTKMIKMEHLKQSPAATGVASPAGILPPVTPTPTTPLLTQQTAAITNLDDALKRIRELEGEVKKLTQSNTNLIEQVQQKQSAIQLLSQHNMTMIVQIQQMAATSQYIAGQSAAASSVTSPSMKPMTPSAGGTPLSPILSTTYHDMQPSTPLIPSTPGGVPMSPQKGMKKPMRKLDEVEAVIYVDSIDMIQPANVENELKKFFAKVNNGGKRGMQAVHAGDGLETVARAVVVALKQVDRLRDKAVYEGQHNDERCSFCINLCLQLLQAITRAICTGMLTLLDSAISQLMDGTRSSYAIEWADKLETSWKSIFDLIFVDSEQTSYTALGSFLDFELCQSCLEELQAFGKSLSYFKMEHMSRMFRVMFTYMKKNHDKAWYLQFCLKIKYYKEYCARMTKDHRYKECLEVILDQIFANTVRTGSYADEDKTYIIEYAVECLRHIIRDDIEAQSMAMDAGDIIPPALYSQMIERIMATCVNVTPRIMFPRELVPLLIFLLELFPSSEAFSMGGDTGQDIRHLTFIADLLFIIVRNIVELDDYDETIDSVKSVGRRIVLECTHSLLEKLIQVKQSPVQSRLKEIIEYDVIFKKSIAQICEKAIWIPIHLEEKDNSWKSIHDCHETLQVRQDDHSEPLRNTILQLLRHIIPTVSDYLSRMMQHLSVALEFKIENRNNNSYDVFFAEMKAIGNHYFRSGREKQWDELLNKIFLIHSRKVKLKKMLKRWNAEQSLNRISTPWYEDLIEDEGVYGHEEDEMEDDYGEAEEDEEEEDDDEMTLDNEYHNSP